MVVKVEMCVACHMTEREGMLGLTFYSIIINIMFIHVYLLAVLITYQHFFKAKLLFTGRYG